MQRLQQASQQSAKRQQAIQKERYDKHSKVREFAAGDAVLLLKPSLNSKISARFEGPYNIVKRMSKTNYLVDLGRRQVIRHVNLLKKFNDRTSTVAMVLEADQLDDASEAELPITIDCSDDGGGFEIGEQLTPRQLEQLAPLLADHG